MGIGHHITMKPKIGSPAFRRMMHDWENSIDPRLKAILSELATWTICEFNKGIIITCLNRTETENQAVGGRPKSSHLDGRAVDFRSWTFSSDQIKKVLLHIKRIWQRTDETLVPMVHIIHHDSGRGEHIHLNVNYHYRNACWKGADNGE